MSSARRFRWSMVFPGSGILLAAAMMLGCATPSPVVRLEPKAPNVYWVSGRASIAQHDAGVRAAVAFEHQEGTLLGVRVEVLNQTGAPFEVQPTDFSYVACGNAGVASCGDGQRVVDPETILAALDDRESQANADAENEQAFLAPLLLLSVVGDAASLASGHGRDTTGLQSAALSEELAHSQILHQLEGASIASKRELWSNAAFRKNTLFPGAGVAGLVYLPIQQGVRYLWLTVRAGGHTFPFCFEQTIVPTAPPTRPAQGRITG